MGRCSGDYYKVARRVRRAGASESALPPCSPKGETPWDGANQIRCAWFHGRTVANGVLGGDPGAAGFEGGEDGADVALHHWTSADFQPWPGYHAEHAVSVFVWLPDVDDLGAGQRGKIAQAFAVDGLQDYPA